MFRDVPECSMFLVLSTPSRSIDLISKKNKFARASRFSSFFTVFFFCTTTTLFCRAKSSNFSYTLFLWNNCRMCLPTILSPVFMFASIFHCPSFSPCWPLAFLIRDFKIQRRGRQREHKKNNRFYKQNNNFARTSRFFVHFFARFCTTTT